MFTSKDIADRPVAIALSIATAAVALVLVLGLRGLLKASGQGR